MGPSVVSGRFPDWPTFPHPVWGGRTPAFLGPRPSPAAAPSPPQHHPRLPAQFGFVLLPPADLRHLALTPQSLEDLEDQKRKKKKEKMGFGSISRVFARGKQRKSLDPGLFDGTAPDYYIEEDADW